MLYHFGTITPWATAFTVLVNPLVLWITVLGFLKILVIAWLPSVSMVLGVIVAALSDTMTWATVVLSKVPLCQIGIGQVGIAWIGVLYILMMAIAWWPMRWGGRRFLRPSLAMAVVLLLSILHGWRSPSDTLEMTCLSVGPGQAIVLRLPGGETWLIDAGSQSSPNIGQRIVQPFLRQIGIDRLKGVIISHADADHFNGLPEIAAVTPIGSIRTNRAFLDKAQTLSGAGFLRQSVEKMGFRLDDIAAADWPAATVKIRPLWPAGQSADPALSKNDQSEVLLVEYAGKRILICSDIEAASQSLLMDRIPDLKADVVVLPHHGSAATTQSSFLTTLAPSTVIASCAASRTAAAWKPSDPSIAAWYTGRDGAVTVTIKADGTVRTIGFVCDSDGESLKVE
jgi:competence protein ComEC